MKKIMVTVKTRSKRPGVLRMGEGWYLVSVAELPADGEANVAVAKALAKHLGVAPSLLTLARGAGHTEKVFHLEEV